MARVHTTKANGQAERKCGRCGHVIEKGESYFWAKPGFRTRRPVVRCSKHPFRQSELTTGVRSEALAAVEAFEDAIDSVDSFDLLDSVRTDLESALDDYVFTREEALGAWPNGNIQLEEYRDQAESARDEVAGWSANYSDTDEPDEDTLDEMAAVAREDGDHFTREDLVEVWLQEKLEEAKSDLSDVVSGLDL